MMFLGIYVTLITEQSKKKGRYSMLKGIFLLLIDAMDPIILAFIMHYRFQEKLSSKKGYCLLYFGSYLLTILKQYASYVHLGVGVAITLTLLVQFFYIAVMQFFYEGKWYKKFFIYGVYSLCALFAEGLVVWGTRFFLRTPIEQIAKFGVVNIMCTSLAKVILILLVYSILLRNKLVSKKLFHDRELLPIIIAVIILHIPTIALFDRPELFETSQVMVGYFIIVQLILVILIFYILYVVQINKVKMSMVQKKLQSAEEIIRLNTSIRELKHDMTFHVNILLDLAYKGNREEMIQYMENTFECVRILEQTFDLKDQAVSSSLNLISQKAREKNIQFRHIIMIEDFILPSHDMCSLLLNILSNAMDATEQVKQRYRAISLVISPEQAGYTINCMNTYKHKPEFRRGKMVSSKPDEASHGKGIRIIKKIVEKHGGAMNIMIHEEEKIYEISCFIPFVMR